MATDDHQPFKTPKTPSSSSNKGNKKRIPSPMATDDHQPFKGPKIPSSSSKDKKKRISSPMVTDDHQPFKRPKTPSSSSKDKKKRISGSMANDDHQPPFKRLPKAKPSSSSSSSSSTPTQTPSMAWGRWEELPYDIVSIILQKLILQDHLRFSCVCVRWNLAVRGGGGVGHGHPSPKPQLPWLMIAGAGRDCTSAKFISLSEHRTYDIPLPHPPIRKRLCIGSSHGWLITLHNLSEMHLLNPITGVQVPLPSITTTVPAPTALPSGYQKTGSPSGLDYFFGKAILSSAPSRDGTGDFTVFLIRSMPLSWYRTLAIARIGDDAWTTFVDEHIFDIVYHKGQILIMGIGGFIHVWEQQQHDHHLYTVPRFSIDTKDFLHNNIPLGPYRPGLWCKQLVQSMTGELFMLFPVNIPTRHRKKFRIARLDLDRNEYVMVDDLKDLVFFTGINDSIVVSATEYPELKRNCVYFTKFYFVSRVILKKLSSQSNKSPPPPPVVTGGVFEVEKDEADELLDIIGSQLSLEEKKHIGSLLSWPPPAWITPTLF